MELHTSLHTTHLPCGKRQAGFITCTYDALVFNCPVNGKSADNPSGQTQKRTKSHWKGLPSSLIAFKIQMNPPKSANLANSELLLGLPFSSLWDYTCYD